MPSDAMPALWKRTSTLPKALSVAAAAASVAWRLPRSTGFVSTRTPYKAVSSSRATRSVSALRPKSMSDAPAAASASEMLRPIPRPPPVTTAIRPFRLNNASIFITGSYSSKIGGSPRDQFAHQGDDGVLFDEIRRGGGPSFKHQLRDTDHQGQLPEAAVGFIERDVLYGTPGKALVLFDGFFARW